MHSAELRHRAVLHYQLHLASLRKVAKHYNVGKSTLARWVKRDLGKAERPRPRTRRSLHSTIANVVAEAIKCQPFQTADMLRETVRRATEAKVSRSTVYRTLAKLRYSHKRSSRCKDHEPLPLKHPFMERDSYEGDCIAIDESSFYVNDVPTMGWGPKGKRVKKARPSHRTRVTLILAVSKDGIVHHETRVGKVNSLHFAAFVEGLPSGKPIICDNCSIHKAGCVMEVLGRKRMELRLTPPYCPWYNPVEFCFSEIKRRYRPVRLLTPAANFVDDLIACMRQLRHQGQYFEHASRACAKDRASAWL